MRYLLDAIYLLALLALSPWLLYKSLTTGKYRRGMGQKLLGSVLARGARPNGSRLVWFHGVSVGEIHLLRQVVARFRQRFPHFQVVISTTTDTGHAEACKHFADLPVFYWPFDFSWAVRRALRRVKPNLVVLAEGELWPNFLGAAKSMGVPVAVINGRMSPRSARHYRRLGLLVRGLLGCLDVIAAQTEEYAECYRDLGAAPDRVRVTGSVKYDGVERNRRNSKTSELRRLLVVEANDLVWIAGSTQAPEEEIVVNLFQRIRGEYPHLRLMLVPRQKERFEEVANLLRKRGARFVRRSEMLGSLEDRQAIFLMDTIGELGALWGLADIAFVGGSLDGRRGGQNMIEPAAYGAAVLFGPHVWNFRETARRLVEQEGAIQVTDATTLETALRRLLNDAGARQRLGSKAQDFVARQQGATKKTLDLLVTLLVPLSRAKAG